MPFCILHSLLNLILKFVMVIVLSHKQIYVHDISHSKTELKLPSIPASPIIDPHLSPDGSMLAYVRDCELHVMNLLFDESKQLTHGAKENGFVSPVVG